MASILSHIAREYRRKLLKTLRPGAVQDPWMRYWEIDIVEDVLGALQPQRCLEWGSGYSTLRFSSLLSQDAHWLSIEHDRDWYERVKVMTEEAAGPRAALEVHCAPPTREPWTIADGDGTAEHFAAYVSLPADRGPFDFILVDGRARTDCLIAARDLVRPDGIVMLHDANRVQYHACLDLYPHQLSFFDHRKNAGGLWIGSLERDIASLIDVPGHQAQWRKASKASKLLWL